MAELVAGDLIDTTVQTVTGKTLGENYSNQKTLQPDVIRPIDQPLMP